MSLSKGNQRLAYVPIERERDHAGCLLCVYFNEIIDHVFLLSL